MTRLCAIIPFYNDFEGIKRLYHHLHKQGIKSIWGDGRFKGFTRINNSDLSTDGSREFILSKDDAVLHDFPILYEYEKKTKLLNSIRDCDYVVSLDCDEYPVGNFKELIKNLDKISGVNPEIYRIKIVVDSTDTADTPVWGGGIVEKIFYKPHRIKCNNTHWSFFIDDSEKPYISPNYIVEGITVHHDQSVRELSRDKLMDLYQHKQILEEAEKFYIHNKDLFKPTIKGLNRLFPNIKPIDNKTHFIIKEKVDANKLPLHWINCMTSDGLCIMK